MNCHQYQLFHFLEFVKNMKHERVEIKQSCKSFEVNDFAEKVRGSCCLVVNFELNVLQKKHFLYLDLHLRKKILTNVKY